MPTDHPLCPCCGSGLLISLKPDARKPRLLHAGVDAVDDKRNLLLCRLHRFWRACAEGENDPGRHGIAFDPETREYAFHIQLADSPEGDTWWSGSFVLLGPTWIRLKSEQTGRL